MEKEMITIPKSEYLGLKANAIRFGLMGFMEIENSPEEYERMIKELEELEIEIEKLREKENG